MYSKSTQVIQRDLVWLKLNSEVKTGRSILTDLYTGHESCAAWPLSCLFKPKCNLYVSLDNQLCSPWVEMKKNRPAGSWVLEGWAVFQTQTPHQNLSIPVNTSRTSEVISIGANSLYLQPEYFHQMENTICSNSPKGIWQDSEFAVHIHTHIKDYNDKPDMFSSNNEGKKKNGRFHRSRDKADISAYDNCWQNY